MKRAIEKILVIRSATRILDQTLKSLKKEFPAARVTVMAPESVKENLLRDPLIDEVIPIRDNKRISVLNYGRANIRRLKDRKFDMAVSLYNVEAGMGYSNIDFLCWASGAPTIRGYNSCGTFVELNGRGVLKKSFREQTTGLWVLLNFFLTLFLFFLITLGLILEWCVRKFSASKQEVAQKEPSPVTEP